MQSEHLGGQACACVDLIQSKTEFDHNERVMIAINHWLPIKVAIQ